ncbi:hypothetical protein [Yoonia sediminilitoris]|uniref:Uncharacterized protein n=1 Tax=Yoonia sediminilitoris TaxID=1286148 RepID=A0A2T6KC13_9RHOB|nr:hypothetical protein [Yoonia sediminilitoris]PUB12413.1 hypothetical protein C8N45_11052 [Yoonia sediminilitoris]RCW93107.1 hypothetical protein DFP92_11052 [Yoonia sediminilitoris]
MIGPLAPAAPSRLRKAAGAGARRIAAAYLRQAQAQAQVLDDWARPGRHYGWIAGQAKLRTGPVLGTGLDRISTAPKAQNDQPAKPKPARKKAPSGAQKPSRPRKAQDLTPHTLPRAGSATQCDVALVKPVRATPGQLRLWSGADVEPPEQLKPARIFTLRKPHPRPLPVPESVPVSKWPETLARRACARLPAAQSRTTGTPAFSNALTHPLAGPTASRDLLHSAITRTKADDRVEHTGAAPAMQQAAPNHAQPTSKIDTSSLEIATGQPRQDAAALAPAPIQRNSAAAGRAARTGQTQVPALAHPAAHPTATAQPTLPANPSSQRAAPSDATAPSTSDPMFSDAIGPPAHTPVTELPPQPDFAQPFAEVLPLESQKAASRAQGAIADEPLTELPPVPNAAPLPRFDRDELGEALAEVLRDEARRHGIDV